MGRITGLEKHLEAAGRFYGPAVDLATTPKTELSVVRPIASAIG